MIDDAARGRSSGQMQTHDIRSREQLIERAIARRITFLDGVFGAPPLRVDDAHAASRGAQRQLAPDLAQPDDAQLFSV